MDSIILFSIDEAKIIFKFLIFSLIVLLKTLRIHFILWNFINNQNQLSKNLIFTI